MTWPFGWVQSEHEDLFFHFPSLTTSFKILHWDSQSDKTKKKEKVGKKELAKSKRREVHKDGEEVHEATSENREDMTIWRNFSKIHKSLNYFFYFYSSSKTFKFLEIYHKTKEVFISAGISIYWPKFGICSGITGMTLVWPVFKLEWNTSVSVLA